LIVRVADIPLDPPVALAPLAGITDLPFRRLVAGFGAGLLVSEMISSGEMVTARPSRRASSTPRSVRMVSRSRPVSSINSHATQRVALPQAPAMVPSLFQNSKFRSAPTPGRNSAN
jgi:tRNA-dihydrouridine synthase